MKFVDHIERIIVGLHFNRHSQIQRLHSKPLKGLFLDFKFFVHKIYLEWKMNDESEPLGAYGQNL